MSKRKKKHKQFLAPHKTDNISESDKNLDLMGWDQSSEWTKSLGST